MKLKLYHDDFRESPRRSESSEKVVRYWFDGRVVYDVETAVTDEECLGIIAERIVLRRLLGIGGGEKEHVPYVLDARPFGEDGPKCADLIMPEVFVAMAFVPLTPLGETDRPVLARLYCVRGLPRRYFPSGMLQDGLVLGMESYSWFLTGLPDEKHGRAIDGRSWLLAVELLKRVVAKRDITTARNLAKHFIVTGDTRDGLICRVEMGRKGELTQRRVYKDFNWIIPKENDMSIPLRKIKKFDNVDSAYDFIEKMRNRETINLTKMAEVGSAHESDAYLGLLQNGADPSEVVLGVNARQRFLNSDIVGWRAKMRSLEDALRGGGVCESRIRSLLDPICAQFSNLFNVDRAMSYYGDVPQMYFLFAKLGDEEMLDLLRERGFDINATDNQGATALDFACESGEDSYVKDVLEKRGCKRRIFEIGSERMQVAMRSVRNAKSRKFLLEALSRGLSPNQELIFAEDENVVDEWRTTQECYDTEDDVIANEPSIRKTFAHAWRRYSTTLLLEAIYAADQELVDACLKHGGDWQSEVRLAYDSQLEREDYYASRTGEAPLINKVEWNFQPKDMSIYKFLKEYHNNIDAAMLAVLRQTGDFGD